MLESLRELPIVGDVRGAGYFQAIELVKDKETKESFDDEESETLLRGFLSGELYRRGLICRADDRGDPVIQLSPPLIAGPEQFEEIEEILRGVLTEAGERMHVHAGARHYSARARRCAAADADRTGPAARPGRPPARGRARPAPAGALGAHLRAARPDPVAVRWRAAADHRHAARDAGPGSGSSPRGWPIITWPGSGSGRASSTPPCPSRCSRSAAEREFPVFEVPYEVPFIAVTEAAFTQLVNEQYAVLRRALAAQERLERIVLSERGLDALVGALATLIGAAVVVFDSRGEPLQQHAFRRAIEPEVLETLRGEVRERARRREARAFMPSLVDGNQGLALPVASDGAPRPGHRTAVPGRAPEAWLVAIKDAGPLSDFDRLTLHQAVTIVALELLRARVAGDTERRLAGDVLDAIVSGELTGSELARRLGPFGLADRVAAIVLGARRRATARHRRGRARWRRRCGARCARRPSPALVASVGPLACALVPGGGRRGPVRARRARRGRGGRRAARSRAGRASGARCRRSTRGGAFTRRAARSRRWRSGVAGLGRQRARRPSVPSGGHVQGSRVFPAAALAAGRRGAAAVLRLDPRARSRPARARTAAS